MREEVPPRVPTDYPECTIIQRDVARTNQLRLGAVVRLPEGGEDWIPNSDLVRNSNRDHGVEWRVVVTPTGLCWEPRIGWDELERLAAANHAPTYGTRQSSREATDTADTQIIGASDDDRSEDSNPDCSLTYIDDFGQAVVIAQPLTEAPSPSPQPADQGVRLPRPCASTLSYRPQVPSNILQIAYTNTILNWFAEQPRPAAFRAFWPCVPARYFEPESESEDSFEAISEDLESTSSESKDFDEESNQGPDSVEQAPSSMDFLNHPPLSRGYLSLRDLEINRTGQDQHFEQQLQDLQQSRDFERLIAGFPDCDNNQEMETTSQGPGSSHHNEEADDDIVESEDAVEEPEHAPQDDNTDKSTSDSESGSVPGSEPGPEQDSEPGPEQDSETDSEQGSEPGPEQDSETDSEQDSEPGPEQDSEADSESHIYHTPAEQPAELMDDNGQLIRLEEMGDFKKRNGSQDELRNSGIPYARDGDGPALVSVALYKTIPYPAPLYPNEFETTQLSLGPSNPNEDSQGHFASALGPDQQHQVWQHGPVEDNQVPRVATSEQFLSQVLARCCKTALNCITGQTPAVTKRTKALRNRLSLVGHPRDRKVDAIPVAFSSLDQELVLMYRDKEDPGTYEDNFIGVILKIEKSQQVIGNACNFFESVLVPGNLGYLKMALWRKLTRSGWQRFLGILMRENQRLFDGLGTLGIAKVHASAANQPHFGSWGRTKPYDSLHYVLRWPLLAFLQFKPEMIRQVRNFLAGYPNDYIPLNIALAAIIIYFDLDDEDFKGPEGFSWGSDKYPKHEIVAPALEPFIIYFPHMLRFCEEKRLTAFIHPMRWAQTQARADETGKFHKQFDVPRNVLDKNQMRKWVEGLKSNSPEVPVETRHLLIPASMPGTRMVFPTGHRSANRPSAELFARCHLNDVQTLGLPSYDFRNPAYRGIGIPVNLLPHLTVSMRNGKGFRNGPAPTYWIPERKANWQCLSGEQQFVGPIFPAIEPTKPVEEAGPQVPDRKRPASEISKEFMEEAIQFAQAQMIPAHYRNRNGHAIQMSLAALRHLGYLQDDTVIWNPDYQRLEWGGFKEELRMLEEDGIMDLLERNLVPQPRAKRIKLEGFDNGDSETEVETVQGTPPPDAAHEGDDGALSGPMDRDLVEDIYKKVSNLKLKCRTWNMLGAYLKEAEEPTFEGAQEHLRSVWRDCALQMDNVLPPKPTRRFTGEYDDLIRLMLLASGAVPANKAATIIYSNHWNEVLGVFKESEPEVSQALDGIYQVRSLPGSTALDGMTRGIVAKLRGSSCIKGQVTLYNEVRVALHGDQPDGGFGMNFGLEDD